ncbi:Domain of unknown function (DUF1985 [Striga hermonthica]|uniref:DUF1985 domain-containing protein n=1 Tax=Striga hermonthica TaxID=68872 RepID=A0A9N7N7W7_STRHE|nr:Domain of unknown function (DUF1985 [Striga hermonthica]
MRRDPKSKIDNSTEKGSSSDSDFEDEIQPEDVDSEELLREEESPEWELLISHPRDINVKMQNSNDNSKEKCTISDIKKMLTKEKLEAFRMSCYGKFLDLPHCIVQNQLVNYILLCEVHQSSTDEIWFDFGVKFLRFDIEEFAVVTGLKCTGLTKKLNIPKIVNGLNDKYFDGIEITQSHISPKCDEYSWGTAVFQFTLNYLKKSIQTREQMHISDNAEGSNLYQLYGLILALRAWFYEVSDTAEGVVATHVGVYDIPRIIKWEVRETSTRSFVQRTFSNLDYSKTPSSAAPQHTNEDDVITHLDTLTAEVQNLKEAFHDFSRRVFIEFAW